MERKRSVPTDGIVRRRSSNLPPGTASSLVIQTFQARADAARLKDRSSSGSSARSSDGKSIDRLQSLLSTAPGCYPGDDGSADIAERYNFFAHGKRFLFAPCSLGIFPESNQFRQALIWCITWKRFDQFILLIIAANSIILAIADYSNINEQGDLDSSRSFRNAIVNYADSVFTVIFSVECTMKIIAMGMVGEKGAYLMDPWNCMDFIVVFVGILALLPGIPNVSVLRTFRVLRPLRSLNAVAGMKKLVTSLLKSIPELLTVVAFLSFLFFLYGVIGVQLWSGVLHARCRLTPYPVRLEPNLTYSGFGDYQQEVLSNVSLFPCSDSNGSQIPVAADEWSQDTSPWKIPRICYWPIADEQNPQTCSLFRGSFRQCPPEQTCGSDYDTFGNFRFTHPDRLIFRNVITAASYNENMSWGYMSFDHIGLAALAIFQCITLQGWSDMMYMLQDAGYGVVSVFYFISFIVIGSFFMLNLTLAVIWENFSEASLQEAEEKESHRHKLAPARRLNAPNPSGSSATRTFIRAVIDHWLFSMARTVLILLNTIILSLDEYPTQPKIVNAVETINFGLTLAFLLECLLKIIGLGFAEWKRDGYNWLDVIVVVLGIAENLLSPPDFLPGEQTKSTKTASFSGFRSVRLFALFKLARSWPSLHKLLATMVSTIKEVGNFSVLFLLFMYIYALIGMQTFANQFRFDELGHPVSPNEAVAYTPRSNFDTMLWSFVTVFQILTGDNWNDVMYDGWRSSGWSAVLYFLSLVVIGDFILLNLFLAILLGNFEETSDDEKREEREREELKRRARVAPGTLTSSRSELEGPGIWRSERDAALISTVSEHSEVGRVAIPQPERVAIPHSERVMSQQLSMATSRSRRDSNASKVFSDHVPRNQPISGPARTMTSHSLMVLSVHNPLRKMTIKVISHPHFDNISLALVLISTVSLAIDNPLNPPDSLFVTVLSWVDYMLTILFIVEVVVKIIALGFLFDRHAYLRNTWNVMDFVITTLAAFSLGEGRGRFKFVKTLRTFRALRPLRMINRNPGLKLVVSSLIASIPQILNVIMVCLLVFTTFSIVAVNNLKGKLYSCQGDIFDAMSSAQQDLITYPRLWSNMTNAEKNWFNATSSIQFRAITDTEKLTSRVMCGLLGAEWKERIPQNFNNVLHGIQTFFQMTTTEGWVSIMLASVDATEIDMQPIPNYRQGWTFFFSAFMLVGTFFIMQLFVGVVIENFNRMKEKLDGTYLLSTAQREWLTINETMLNLRPTRKMKTPKDHIRRAMFRLARNATFEVVMVGCIMLNTVIMALHYFGEEDFYRKSIETSNYVFAVIFSLEVAIKIIGLGSYYWKDSWNVFDFVVVVGTFLEMVYQWWMMGSSVGTLATTIRSVRVGRLFRLLQSAPSLRQLFNTLLITLPSLVNIGGLLFLVLFIYAAMGVQLFAKVKFGDKVTPTANFQSISRAILTLIRCATGEQWNDYMYELASQDNCTPDPDYNSSMCGFTSDPECIPLNGCGSPAAFAYLYSFMLLVSFILLNIFIAVILEGFANEKDRADGILLPAHYENFVATWSIFDPEATGFIDWYMLPTFLEALDPPMGFYKSYKPSVKEIIGLIELLDLPVFRGNKVFFNDVARRIGKFVVDEMVDEPLKPLPASLNLEQRWRKYLQGRKVKKQDHTMHRVNQFHSAVFLHDAVKALIFREDVKDKVHKLARRVQLCYQPRVRTTALTPIDEPVPVAEESSRNRKQTPSTTCSHSLKTC